MLMFKLPKRVVEWVSKAWTEFEKAGAPRLLSQGSFEIALLGAFSKPHRDDEQFHRLELPPIGQVAAAAT